MKLAKCGGVGPAKRMLGRARELGFQTLPRLHGGDLASGSPHRRPVASLADWVDLDGCLLIAADPFEGLDLDADHRWRLTDAPGLGDPPGRLRPD